MTREELLKLHNELTTTARELMQAKNSDYNANDDPFGNLSACEIIGVPPLKGVLVRMLDKFKRLESFASGKDMQVSDERLTDTVVDMINYAVIFAAMASEESSCFYGGDDCEDAIDRCCENRILPADIRPRMFDASDCDNGSWEAFDELCEIIKGTSDQ